MPPRTFIEMPPEAHAEMLAAVRRALVALLKAPPRTYGWCRTRWRGATRALTWQATRGITISAETRRRWVHEVDWVGKRPKRVAKDDDPRRVERLARIRVTFAPLKRSEAMGFADALDIHLWPTVGYAWMPTGTPLTVRTPGPKAKHDRAGALARATGALRHGVAARQTTALCRDRLTRLEAYDPAARYTRLSVVVDHESSHHAKAVEQGLAAHPRVTLLWVPTEGPRATPLARACGNVHDRCTRQHTRTRLRDLVAEVEAPLQVNGPWPYQRSESYSEPAVTAAVENSAAEPHATIAA